MGFIENENAVSLEESVVNEAPVTVEEAVVATESGETPAEA